MRCLLAVAAALAGCAGPPRTGPDAVALAERLAPDLHVPDYARRPYERFSSVNVVGIALREWRAFGSVVNDEGPGSRDAEPEAARPDMQPGLWQRVGDYWWGGQDAGSRASHWSTRYDGAGRPLDPAGSPAWSAAFVSYVMRMAGAGDRFTYSPLHADYINAAREGLGALSAEQPDAYAPQPGDLICTGRGAAAGIRFEDLPSARFTSHCDIVVAAAPGMLSVVGGNVAGGVTLKHVPTTPEGRLAPPGGPPADPRFDWFVTVRVAYDIAGGA